MQFRDGFISCLEKLVHYYIHFISLKQDIFHYWNFTQNWYFYGSLTNLDFYYYKPHRLIKILFFLCFVFKTLRFLLSVFLLNFRQKITLKLLRYLTQCFLTILFYHVSSFFQLIINLYFLIPAVIAQIFNPFAELLIPIGTPGKEAKAEIQIHQ